MLTKFVDENTVEVFDSKGRKFLISPEDEALVKEYRREYCNG